MSPLRRASLRSLAAVAVLALGAASFTAARAAFFDDEVVPSGDVRTETRQPGSFSRVALGGSFDVEIRQGSREAITIRADDNVLPLVETKIEGSGDHATLQVRLRRHTTLRSKPRIAVTVEMVRVDAIALGGLGDVVAKGLKTGKLSVALGGVGNIDLSSLDTDDLTLSLGGTGRIKVSGRAAAMKLSLAGSGACETDGLAASDVTIAIAGSGDAHVRADKSLKVTIAGSGNVVYRGDATPSTTVIGSGSIRKG